MTFTVVAIGILTKQAGLTDADPIVLCLYSSGNPQVTTQNQYFAFKFYC